ncbi:ribonuclease III [Pendulispora rubella]|uniref:Ribonuclease 3 n=1 Tax=Pendulispora rubella TaxID=2741070 RepID=A0ABZ2KZF6_9BACT
MKRDVEERIRCRAALLVRIKSLVGDIEIPRFDEALTHPSYANEAGGAPDYERLEFLGDAVLGLCVSELLVASHPGADEGTLSRMRSALVNADALARWARAESIGPSLALGRGAAAAGEQFRTNVLADAVEALVAAVYTAGGLDAARGLVQEVVREPLATAAGALGGRDPKSALQEWVQAQGNLPPAYRVVATHGPAHERVFRVEVAVGEQVLAAGEGPSKRLAERAAAAAALENLGGSESVPLTVPVPGYQVGLRDGSGEKG